MSGRGPPGPSSPSKSRAASPEAAQTLRRAISLHQAGQLDEAERLYRALLTASPRNPDALHFLGVLSSQRGRNQEAIDLIGRSLEVNPSNPAALYNRANALRDLERRNEALAEYDSVVALKPDHAGAWNNRGALLHGLRRYEEAIRSYDRAIKIKPDHLDAHVNRADALFELEQWTDALKAYERVLSLTPREPRAHGGMANALLALERGEEALASYNRAVALAPRDADLLNNRGNALARLHRYRESLASYSQAIAQNPGHSEAYANRGDVHMQLRMHDAAVADYDHALAKQPDNAKALYGRGSALVELNRHDEAAEAFSRLLAAAPDYPYARGMMVHARRTACDWRNHPSDIDQLIVNVREQKRAATPLVLLAVSDSTADKRRCAERLVSDKFAYENKIERRRAVQHDRIRVAYLSADFREHAVAMLTAGMFEHHDRSRFQTIAISYGNSDGSAIRQRLVRSFDEFVEASDKSDAEVAELLSRMEADIAVDLTGFTGGGRPGILARRPAPVQVNFLGYAGTLGADFMDYIICDSTVIPKDQESDYAEEPARLPDTFLPHDSKRRVAARTPTRAEAGLPERAFVFCSFNNSYKFGPEIFDIWMRLLHKTEGSVLWLSTSNRSATQNIRREAAARGIDPQRLIFAPYLAAPEDHLARLKLADLFLDTLPYNAHTTATDALWAGLPLLTCIGKSFAGRVAASLLRAAGMPDLVVECLEAYEDLALELASSPWKLAEIRERLLHNRDTCALFDTARFTRNLEQAYIQMWERSRANQPPASFSVAASPRPA